MGSPMSGNGFKDKGRIIIVGASLAGLRAAEALREEGFRGRLTIIGDEPDEPYDRPPLSKQVLAGWVRADHTKLPRLRAVDAEWRLGVAATELDRANRLVRLADGSVVEGDRLLIATGVRSRKWPNADEAALEGVYTLRTSGDAARLQATLAAKPQRVLIIGSGFIGSEVASVCRDLGLEVTVAERGPAPLSCCAGRGNRNDCRRDAACGRGGPVAPVSRCWRWRAMRAGMCAACAYPMAPRWMSMRW